MKSYYENLDERINEGDIDAIDELLTLMEEKDEEAVSRYVAAKEAREQRERPVVNNPVDPEFAPITVD